MKTSKEEIRMLLCKQMLWLWCACVLSDNFFLLLCLMVLLVRFPLGWEQLGRYFLLFLFLVTSFWFWRRVGVF